MTRRRAGRSLGKTLLPVLLSSLTTVGAWLPTVHYSILPLSRFAESFPFQRISTASTILYTTSDGNKSKKNTNTASHSKFAQPAFRQAAYTGTTRKERQTPGPEQHTTHRSPQPFGADSKISSLHLERVRTAGRVGTKRYVNPCKVFVGNLPFAMDESALQTWLSAQMGLPPAVLLNECKIVRDWKTGKSKGFGFAVFTEAIYATVCIEKCHSAKLESRTVTVKQGQRKPDENLVYIKKRKEQPSDAEEAAIQNGLTQAEGHIRDDIVIMDPEEMAMIKMLDPDLLPDHVQINGSSNSASSVSSSSSSSAYSSDDILFDDIDEDDDEGVDGFWYGDDDEAGDDDSDIQLDTTMTQNREQRREAAKRQPKRRKLINKGFGTV
jgi:hypothetical protein